MPGSRSDYPEGVSPPRNDLTHELAHQFVPDTSDAGLRNVLHALPGVDQVGAEARAAMLASRSIKNDAKRTALDLAISMVDLTTLEGADTAGKVASLCAKALHPDPTDALVPSVAAVCVYGDMAGIARTAVGDRLHVAAVATAFPSGRASLDVKLADTAAAVDLGADEIDMVIDRGAFLAGNYGLVFEQIAKIKQACGAAHLKVILETGELRTLDNVRRASWLAMSAGARLHQDIDGQDLTGGDYAGHSRHARSGARLAGSHRSADRGQARRWDPNSEGRHPLSRHGSGGRRFRVVDPGPVPIRRLEPAQ